MAHSHATRYARVIARKSIGLFERLDGIRRDIAARRLIIAELAAAGTEVREHVRCASDAEFRMGRAVYGLAVYKRRYAEALAELTIRRPLPLPKAAKTPTAAPTSISRLAADVLRVIPTGQRASTADLARHLGIARLCIVNALDEIEAFGIRLHRTQEPYGSVELDDAAEQVDVPVRAASTLAGDLRVSQLPGGGIYASNMRKGRPLRKGTASLNTVVTRFAEREAQTAAGRTV